MIVWMDDKEIIRRLNAMYKNQQCGTSGKDGLNEIRQKLRYAEDGEVIIMLETPWIAPLGPAVEWLASQEKTNFWVDDSSADGRKWIKGKKPSQ